MSDEEGKKPLVSIITPCYNGEQNVARLLKSILDQTYSPLEFIFVNDGSTDRTEEIVLSYRKKFENKGIDFQYIYQENLGLGGAINTGLKKFTGEYLCWPDSDDWLAKDSIQKRVEFLECHLDYGAVDSDAYVYLEKDLNKPYKRMVKRNPIRYDVWQFDHLLCSRSVFCPGCHMVRSSAFLEVNPSRSIYPARRGQNWQLLLPVYYRFKRGYIDEPLYNYVIYSNSMSSGDDTKEKCLDRVDGYKHMIVHTLLTMNMEDTARNHYLSVAQDIDTRYRIRIAALFWDRGLLKVAHGKLRSPAFQDHLYYYLGKCGFIKFYSIVRRWVKNVMLAVRSR